MYQPKYVEKFKFYVFEAFYKIIEYSLKYLKSKENEVIVAKIEPNFV